MKMRKFVLLKVMLGGLGALLVLLLPEAAHAEDVPKLDSGDTAWMMTSMVLVLMMTIPGLSLFYCGLVRSKNVLSVMMQCFACTAMITILWMLYGYSLAFGTEGMQAGVFNFKSLVGGFEKAFLLPVEVDTLSGTIPESVWVAFQLTFAIITPALFVGAFAERMKFSACLLFMGLWFTFVYAPICHMAWSGPGSLLGKIIGALDFAGGTVVHINAGIAGLVACIMLGKRKGYPNTPTPPHSLPFCLIGASLLWVGWFGFNAGSAGAANGTAGMAMLVTQIATGTAAFTWMVIEWVKNGKPNALGIATGAVAGLVAITPASGFVGPIGALVIGLAAGACCYLASTSLKTWLGYDDSLDVFGVHAIGGIVGCMLTGIFAAKGLGGFEIENAAIGAQLGKQALSVLITVVWCGGFSFLFLFIIDKVIGLRVSEEVETQGLDISEHGEAGYHELTA